MRNWMVRCGRATAALVAAAGLVVIAPSPVQAVSNAYWVDTKTVNRGSCSATWNNTNWWDYDHVPAGVHFQICIRKLGQNALGNPTYQGYLTMTNSGTTKRYVQVTDSLISSWGVPAQHAGGCYSTALYSRQSLTCRSGTVTFGDAKGQASAYYDVYFAVSGWTSSGVHLGLF